MNSVNPYDKAHELSRAMVKSDVYRRYVVAKKEVAKNSEAEQRVLVFRKLQMEVNQAQMLGQEVTELKITHLSLEFARLNQDQVIGEFLNAEGLFIQMFTDIQQIIQRAIESGFEE